MADIIIKNERLTASVAVPGETYRRSRYDWSGMVRQVELDGKHTFFSGERPGGLDGVGLSSAVEWMDTKYHDACAIADTFPMLGIGLCRRGDMNPFGFTKDYTVLPFDHVIESTESSVTMKTLPRICQGVAVEETKTITLEGNSLRCHYAFRNVGEVAIHATEFVHNFFKFDDITVDDSYELRLPYNVTARMRRGELKLLPYGYKLGEFDAPSQSSAFFVEGYEGLSAHWMRLSHEKSGLSVLVEDDFPVVRFYGWNISDAFCPETFVQIDAEPGETFEYDRVYTFNAE